MPGGRSEDGPGRLHSRRMAHPASRSAAEGPLCGIDGSLVGHSARWEGTGSIVGASCPLGGHRPGVLATGSSRCGQADRKYGEMDTTGVRRSCRRPGTIGNMQHEVSAFHGTSARTRFVLPGNQRRGPRSGLLRVFRTPSGQAASARAAASRAPVGALRAATRGAHHAQAADRGAGAPMQPTVATMRWSRQRHWVDRPRGIAATSWRG